MARQPIVIHARTTINPAPDAEWVPAPRAGGRTRTRLGAAIEELPRETIEAIAQRVAELLSERDRRIGGPRLVDAGQLAQQLGLSRSWVYEHAQDLGGMRLGHGPKARLRFNPETAAKALAEPPTTSPTRATVPSPSRSRGRPRREPPAGADLLPIRARAAIGGMRPGRAAPSE